MRLALGALLLMVLAGASAAPDGGTRLLYPPTRSLLSRPVRLILATAKDAPAPAVTLDGNGLALERLTFADTWRMPGKLKATAALVGDRAATALWAATLDLKPGGHAVVVGEQRLDLWRVGGEAPSTGEAPKDYSRLHSHAPVGEAAPKLDCGGCHELKDGVIGPVPTPQACADCHDESQVQLIHRHVSEPLARCAQCHDPHGTGRPKMLVDAKQVLCSKCHEAGHSKD
jgi:predicted CXXCH cytochrome family protein